MMIRGRNLIIAVSVLFSLVSLQFVPPIALTQSSEGVVKAGPYVDKIMYKVIDDWQIIALQNNEIDLIGDSVDPRYLDTLPESEGIYLANSLKNGYGYLTINCRKYPLNNTAFRRALAFALDKESISDDIWEGLSQPQDSVVPIINPFTIERHLPYTYYSADIEIGNYLLDKAGFEINETTGYRMAPNGSAFDVLVESAISSSIGIDLCQKVVEAFDALYIEATSVADEWGYEALNRLYFHGDYDIFFLSSSFTNFDVDWLAYSFWSENADIPYWNFPNFRNATYDSWRNQLLHSTSYDEVYDAAIEMQRILVYECPMIICYENIRLNAYRTDRFEGFVNDVIDGVHGWWTKYQVRLKNRHGSPVGGTLRISISLDVDTFNILTTHSEYAKKVLSMVYDSLLKLGPDGNDVLWLAEKYIIETNSDNPRIPNGHTRIIFDILQNATWSDGIPLTAEDVAFSFNYYRDIENSTYSRGLEDMISAVAMTPEKMMVEFDTESFWHLHTIGYLPILPKHVFQIIGIDRWNLWDPNPLEDTIVTSGPFNISDYVAGEYIELTRNPDYFFAVNTSSFDTTTTSTTQNALENIMEFISHNKLIIWTITVSSVGILVIMLAKWRIEKK